MQEIVVTMNLESLEALTDMAMNYRKGPNQIPVLVARLVPDKEPEENDFSLQSLFKEDHDDANTRPISIEFVDLDLLLDEPPLIIVESHEIRE